MPTNFQGQNLIAPGTLFSDLISTHTKKKLFCCPRGCGIPTRRHIYTLVCGGGGADAAHIERTADDCVADVMVQAEVPNRSVVLARS